MPKWARTLKRIMQIGRKRMQLESLLDVFPDTISLGEQQANSPLSDKLADMDDKIDDLLVELILCEDDFNLYLERNQGLLGDSRNEPERGNIKDCPDLPEL